VIPRLALLLAAVIWGASFVASRVALQEVGAVDLLGLRLVLAVPILGVVLALQRQTLVRWSGREVGRLTLASAVLTAHFLIQITGLRFTTATNCGWLIATSPLALALISSLVLRERLGLRAAFGIAVATAGVLLLVSRGALGTLGWLHSVGDWLVLASAFTWAIYTVLLRDLSRDRDPLTVTLLVLVPPLALSVALITAGDGWSRFLQLSLRAELAVIYLGVPATALAHWLWQLGVARIGAARAGVFLYLEPLATTAVAVPYLGEPFGWSTAAGGLLVLGGVYLAERRSRQISA
jgi:drug/metabolite transporter (DMT)-like permease